MNSNYVIIKTSSKDNGILAIEKTVFKEIAKNTLLEHKYTNLADAPILGKSISVAFEQGKLVLNIDLEVRYGNRVISVIEDIQKKIFETIATSTNIKDVSVNIGVVGFIF